MSIFSIDGADIVNSNDMAKPFTKTVAVVHCLVMYL